MGQLVKWVDSRNKGLQSVNLLGISIDKYFMPSVANVIGTDLSSYKVVSVDQFACNPMHVGRDEKMPVALYMQEDPSIVSPAYFVFEVIDSNEILPEYLMLWFRRKEFDREVWFHTDGSVRGGILWEELCELTVPVPSIAEQQEIVDAYNDIERRIALKRKINDNLESQIQTIYEEYFEATDYDSTLGDVVECVLGGTPSRDVPSYWNGDIAWINSGKINDFRIVSASEYITAAGLAHSATKLLPYHTVVLAITGATMGQESILLIESCANQSVIGILENERLPYEFIHPFVKSSMRELLRNQTGGAQPHINKDDVNSMPICVPDSEKLRRYVAVVKPLFAQIESNCFEIDKLTNLLCNTLAILSR